MNSGHLSVQTKKTPTNKVGAIRPLQRADLSQISELYDASYGVYNSGAFEKVAGYFEKVFFDNPWLEDGLRSLVYEEPNGQITAFAGVDVRRMVLNGRKIKVVAGGPLWSRLDEKQCAAGLMLLGKVLQGPQDLTVVGANNRVLPLWKFLGGHDNWLSGCRWFRPIRPARLLLSQVCLPRWTAPICWACHPIALCMDSILQKIPMNPFRINASVVEEEPLNIHQMIDHLPEFLELNPLRPDYDPEFLRWLLDCTRGPVNHGEVIGSMVRDSNGKLLGWYVYYLFKDGFGQVVQTVTKPENVAKVMEHLFSSAARRGAFALLGRLDGTVAETCSGRGFFHPYKHPSLLVHSTSKQMLSAALSTNAFMSRLDNEWVHGMFRHSDYGIPHYPR